MKKPQLDRILNMFEKEMGGMDSLFQGWLQDEIQFKPERDRLEDFVDSLRSDFILKLEEHLKTIRDTEEV